VALSPKLHDLPLLQKLCSSRFGWPAAKTLEVAQELYDGQGKKVIRPLAGMPSTCLAFEHHPSPMN
jgi:hypothetical protein